MRLGFDVDEVVVNLADELYSYILKTYNIEWPIDCFSYFKFSECDFHEDLETNKKIRDDLQKISNEPDFQLAAQPYEEAAKHLRKFKRSGHSLHYITSRLKENGDSTVEWFRMHKIPFDTIHMMGGDEKGRMGKSLNLDFFVDDVESHLKSMVKYKKRWRKGLGLLTKPWNKDYIDGSKFIRFNNWQEISRHLGLGKR